MPVEKTPIQVQKTELGNFVDYNGTKIQIPKPIEQMTPSDWSNLALGRNSPLKKIVVDNRSFMGLHVVLKDKNMVPIWLHASGLAKDIPMAYDQARNAIQSGAVLCTKDDIEIPENPYVSADGHIHRDDVVLAKIHVLQYWGIKSAEVGRANSRIEYQSAEGKAFEAIGDQPRHVAGNRDVPVFETTDHQVQYQDRPKF
jgi:hypothetical protein